MSAGGGTEFRARRHADRASPEASCTADNSVPGLAAAASRTVLLCRSVHAASPEALEVVDD